MESTLKSAGILVDSDVEVFATAAQVGALFQRMLQRDIDACLRYDLFKSVGTLARVRAVSVCRWPGSAATRPTTDRRALPVGSTEFPLDSDFLFVGIQRTVDFVNVVAPASRGELVGFETRLERALAARAGA